MSYRSAAWYLLLLILPAGALVGCATLSAPWSSAKKDNDDPLLDAILKQDVVNKQLGAAQLKADIICKEVPPGSLMSEARAVMERHGFVCWGHVHDDNGDCMYCVTYKRKTPYLADRIIVKFFYNKDRVGEIQLRVEYAISRPQ